MRRFLLLLVPFFLAACSPTQLTRLAPEPYKIDIQQGAWLAEEQVARLSPGMTRAQVRFLLGSPPVADPFHADRWDYVYRSSRGGKLVEERKLSLFFQDDKLVRVAGDVIPLSPEDVGSEKTAGRALKEIVLSRADSDQPPAPPPEQKGFFGRWLERLGL